MTVLVMTVRPQRHLRMTTVHASTSDVAFDTSVFPQRCLFHMCIVIDGQIIPYLRT